MQSFESFDDDVQDDGQSENVFESAPYDDYAERGFAEFNKYDNTANESETAPATERELIIEAEPEEVEPEETEPEIEPIKQAEPVRQVEPEKQDVRQSEMKQEPARQEPARQEPVQELAVQTEPIRQAEPIKQEPVKQAEPEIEPIKQIEPARQVEPEIEPTQEPQKEEKEEVVAESAKTAVKSYKRNDYFAYGAGYSSTLDDVPLPYDLIAVEKAAEKAAENAAPQPNSQPKPEEAKSVAAAFVALPKNNAKTDVAQPEKAENDDEIDDDVLDEIDAIEFDETDDAEPEEDDDDIEEEPEEEPEEIVVENKSHASVFASLPRVPQKPLYERYKELDNQTKLLYSRLKNEMLSFKDMKSRMGNKVESFSVKRIQIAKIILSGRTLKVCLALKPDEFDEAVYKHKDVSSKRKFEFTPMMLRLKNERDLDNILDLTRDIMHQNAFDRRKKYEPADYVKELQSVGETALAKAGHDNLIVSNADARAASAIPDDVAEACVEIQESDAVNNVRSQSVAIGQISGAFLSGETVDIKKLKKRGLIDKKTNYIEVTGEGELNKVLTIVSNAYDLDAVKIILSLGGTPVYLKEKQ